MTWPLNSGGTNSTSRTAARTAAAVMSSPMPLRMNRNEASRMRVPSDIAAGPQPLKPLQTMAAPTTAGTG